MSTLTAHSAFAIYQALPEDQKDLFAELVSKQNRRPKPKKKKKNTCKMPAKWQPGNEHMLKAEILNGG